MGLVGPWDAEVDFLVEAVKSGLAAATGLTPQTWGSLDAGGGGFWVLGLSTGTSVPRSSAISLFQLLSWDREGGWASVGSSIWPLVSGLRLGLCLVPK